MQNTKVKCVVVKVVQRVDLECVNIWNWQFVLVFLHWHYYLLLQSIWQ
jgi:hypothetical protein